MTANVIPSPMTGHGLVYALSGFRGNAIRAIKLGRTGELTGTDAIAWSTARGVSYTPSPLLHAGRLHVVSDAGLVSAFDAATGKVLWETTLPAAGNATPAVYEVNGKQYVAIAAGGGKWGAPSGGSYVAFALP